MSSIDRHPVRRRPDAGQAVVQGMILLALLCFIALVVFQVMEARHYGMLTWLPF